MTIDEAVEKLVSVRHHIVLREVHYAVLKEFASTLDGARSTAESSL